MSAEVVALADRVHDALKSTIHRAVSGLLDRLSAIERRLDALPDPERGERGPAGKDAEVDYDRIGEIIAVAVAKEHAKLPVPRDGKDGRDAPAIDYGQIVEMVRSAAQSAVADMPRPKDGRDGKDGAAGRDGKDGANGRDGIDGKDGDAGRDGEDGKDGRDGKDVDPIVVRELVDAQVSAAVAAIPVKEGPQGPRGEPGQDGKDGAAGRDGDTGPAGADAYLIARAHGFVGSPLEWLESLRGKDGANGADGATGRDGERGKDGANGADGRDGVQGVAGKDGDPGRDGRDGRDGDDGFAPDDFSVELRDGRVLAITMQCATRVVTKECVLKGLPLDCGVWRQGGYEKGDVVTYGGSAFIAQRDTSAPIGGNPPSPDWRLMVKRGQDGR